MHGGSGSRTGLDPESSYVASHVGPAVHHVTSTDAGLMAYSAFKQRAPNIQCKFKASEFQALQQRHHLHTRCICERLRLEQALPPVLLAEQAIRHFRRCKQNNPGTAAAILLPKVHKAPLGTGTERHGINQGVSDG
eukprot:1160916-Pelagomonas_calceolata.AAC.8